MWRRASVLRSDMGRQASAHSMLVLFGDLSGERKLLGVLGVIEHNRKNLAARSPRHPGQGQPRRPSPVHRHTDDGG